MTRIELRTHRPFTQPSPWNDPRSYAPDLYEGLSGDAVPARAATPSGLSRFASSCKHHIAIASVALCIFCAAYFAWQFVR